MNEDNRPQVKAVLQRLRNSAPANQPEPTATRPSVQPSGARRRLVAAAALVMVLIGVGAIAALNRDDPGGTTTATTPVPSNPNVDSTVPAIGPATTTPPTSAEVSGTVVTSTTDIPEVAAGELPFGLTRCTDRPNVSADPSYYRDEPVYIANEMPVDEVRAWADQQAGFEEIWIDRDHNGWITVGFAPAIDVQARQQELEATFPGVGVVAVAVPYTTSELEDLSTQVLDAIADQDTSFGSSIMVSQGEVVVLVGVLDESTLAPLAGFAGRPVCFDGIDPADAVIDGPQPANGDGWRLLADELTGEPYRTGVATTADQYAELWASSGVSGEQPPVDFESEIVIWFGAVYGSNCPIRMDDIIIDQTQALIHTQLVNPGNPVVCNSDANPHSFIVAIERNQLPVGPFNVQLSATDPPAGAPEERTVVAVDLSTPGSTASNDEIGPDPSLVQVPIGPFIGPGGTVEVGQAGAWFVVHLPCDVSVIGPVNGVTWQADTLATGEIDPTWETAAHPDGTLYLELVVETDPPKLTLYDQGHAETYSPAPPGTVGNCT